MIYGDLDCSAVDFVMNRFSKRLKERHEHVNGLIGKKFDFTVDEYMEVDRKEMDFAKTSEELDFGENGQFQLLNLKTSLKDMKKAKGASQEI